MVTLQEFFYGETAFEVVGVRAMDKKIPVRQNENYLVELRGVEPLSENPLHRLSPGAVIYFILSSDGGK